MLLILYGKRKKNKKKWNNTSNSWLKRFTIIKFGHFCGSLRPTFQPKTDLTTVLVLSKITQTGLKLLVLDFRFVRDELVWHRLHYHQFSTQYILGNTFGTDYIPVCLQGKYLSYLVQTENIIFYLVFTYITDYISVVEVLIY